MVDIEIVEDKLLLHVRGADKLWALKSSLEIPLEHVQAVRADSAAARNWCDGMRVLGTSIPGVITAGTFYHQNGLVFWDVHNPANAIVITLHDERYRELVVEVADPAAAVSLVSSVLRR